jgi:uncharacterized protein YgiB involved in biofilm formation
MTRRKSSARVTLVLIGVATLAGCGRAPEQRDVYATREDCLADWNSKPEDCKPATEARHSSRGFWYGPMYPIPYGTGSGVFSRGSSRSIGSSSSGTHSSSVSRGGFGSSARSSGG